MSRPHIMAASLSWQVLLFIGFAIAALQNVLALPHTPPPPRPSHAPLQGLLTRQRSAKIASVHGLQAVAESLPNRLQPQNDSTLSRLTTTSLLDIAAGSAPGKYEIRSVAGEPNYKSVNLTWEVEFVPAATSAGDGVDGGGSSADGEAVTNSSAEVEPPRAFQVYFCELQAFGPHRCRSKLVDAGEQLLAVEPAEPFAEAAEGEGEGDIIEPPVGGKHRQVRQYALQIENLRMATKYSFHIRAQRTRRSMKKIADRIELNFDNEVDANEVADNNFDGQSIIIPTKGFSAEATKCLPHASEIEVETGPYFGGKIVVDGGNCGVKGNPDDATAKYTMRIDHKMCGSLVKPETNTVETFITVQENLGIYTHSTRRFVVVCSFQSGMQTVRASFSVPGKGGVAAPVENDPFIPDERVGREQRLMRYVNKSELVLKESNTGGGDEEAFEFPNTMSQESEALVQEVMAPELVGETAAVAAASAGDTPNSVAVLEGIVPGLNERHIRHDDMANEIEDVARDGAANVAVERPTSGALKAIKTKRVTPTSDGGDAAVRMPAANVNYAKLIVDQAEHESGHEWSAHWHAAASEEDERSARTPLHFLTAHVGSVLLTVAVSVIIVALFVGLLWRELKRARFQHTKRATAPPLPPKQRKDVAL